MAASGITETDITLSPAAAWSSGTTYYFRLVLAGSAVSLDTGKSYPSITLTQAAGAFVWGGILKFYNGSQWTECPSSKFKIYLNSTWTVCPSTNFKIYRPDKDPAGWYPIRFQG